MKATIAFEGGKELDHALASLPKRVGRSIVKDVLLFAAEPMRRRMARLAPRSGDEHHIADNVIAKMTRRKMDLPTPNSTAVAIGPTTPFFYAHFVEYGTSDTAAHPFMRPSFDSEVQRAIEQIKSSLWVELAGRGIQQQVTAPTWQSGGAAGGDES